MWFFLPCVVLLICYNKIKYRHLVQLPRNFESRLFFKFNHLNFTFIKSVIPCNILDSIENRIYMGNRTWIDVMTQSYPFIKLSYYVQMESRFVRTHGLYWHLCRAGDFITKGICTALWEKRYEWKSTAYPRIVGLLYHFYSGGRFMAA